MRVFILRTHYPHWGAYSGINQFIKYVNKSAYRTREVLVPDNDSDFIIRNARVRERARTFIQKGGMQWYKLSDLTAEARMCRRCLRQRIDVVHYLDGEHSAQFLPQAPRSLGRLRPKVLATYHQPPDILDTLVSRKVVAKLDCITVVSPEQTSYFTDFVAPEKVRVILHGIDTGFFRPDPTARADQTFRCITVGYWLRDYRALRMVAEALESYRNIEFGVVSSRIDELAGLSNVKTYSGIDDATLLRLYQRADVLFLPLLSSTANNSLLEGIACGLPVLSTALPSVKAYVPGEEAILIKDNAPGSFVEAILHLASHPEERRRMGQQARKRAQELDWSNVAPQFEEIYAELASRQSSAGDN